MVGACLLPRSARRGLRLLASLAGAALVVGAPALRAAASGGRAAAAATTVGVTLPRDEGPHNDAVDPKGAAATTVGVTLPRDEGPHNDAVEWWYFNGHLTGTDAAGKVHTYGFEYVTFQFRLFGSKPVYIGNFAVSDVDRKAFHYAATTSTSKEPASPGRFALTTGQWSMSGAAGDDTLRAALPGYSIDLALHSTEPPALEGPGGVVGLGPLGTADYYSWTSLATSGTVTDHGAAIHVTGESWMDHEWSNTLSGAAGWDWFSVQLHDSSQYMLEFVRSKGGAIVDSNGTDVRGAAVTHLTKADIAEKSLGAWTSPVTHITYSAGWTLHVPGGRLSVTPDLADQELDLRSVQGTVYWEGDCTITGEIDGKPVTGVGYTELNPPGQLGE